MRKIILPLLTTASHLIAVPNVSDFLDSPSSLTYLNSQHLEFTSVKLDEIIDFIHDFQNQTESRYGIRPDIVQALETIKSEVLSSVQFLEDEKRVLLDTCNVQKS